MADVTTTTQYVREAPEIEAYKLGLYQDAQKYIQELQQAGITPPAQGIAGFTAEQLAAGDIIRKGIGGYEPYLGGALDANQAAQQMISQGSAPLLQESLAQQQAGLSGLEQARQLAEAQRQAPFEIRNQALQGLSGSAADIAKAGEGVGSQVLAAQQGLGQSGQLAGGFAQQGIGQLRGSDAQFDPSGISAFMDPFTRQVIEAEQAEIARLGEQQKNQARARQAAAGAFGGSRAAIQEAEIGRNVLQQQARTGAQLRSQGFQQASQQAQQAFEAARQRQQQAAQRGAQLGLSAAELQQRAAQAGGALGLSGQQAMAQMAGQRANIAQQGGQLGLQYGQLAQRDVDQLAALAQQQGAMGQGIAGLALQGGQLAGQLGSLGGQQAALGQQAQQQRATDAQQLLQYGGMGQQQAQNVLNAQYAAEQQAFQQPLKQIAFLGDLSKGLPSSQSAVFQQTSPSPSLAQTAGGLALGAAGLARATRAF
jgi:hypothetical protein